MDINLKTLKAQDVTNIHSAFLNSEWKTPESYLNKMLTAQEKGEVVFLVAYYRNTIAGFVYIKWQADYPPFAEKGIPENPRPSRPFGIPAARYCHRSHGRGGKAHL